MARDVADTATDCKPQRKRRDRDCWQWYRHYPQQWLNGTRHLSPLARAAYADILSLIYLDADGRIPDANKWIACALHYRAKQWRTARGELFATGKLFARDGYIYNAKANEVHAERVETAERVATTKSKKPRLGTGAGTLKESEKSPKRVHQLGLSFGTISNEINGGVSTESESESEVVESRPTVESPIPVGASSSSAAANVNLDILMQRLVDAGGEALAEPAVAPGLLSLSIPLWWLEQGCDLERDVLPALRKVALRRRGSSFKKILSWEYYNNLVAENRDARGRGLEAKHSPAEPKRNGAYYDPEVARRYKQQTEELLKRPLIRAYKVVEGAA